MKFVIFYIVAMGLSTAASFDGLLPEGRIAGGQDAGVGQFPYMVGIYRLIDPVKPIVAGCGGSLIGHEWVLTAAHCLKYCKLAYVSLGATNIRASAAKHIVSPENFIIHSKFNNLKRDYDIGLIKIPLTKFTTEIQPVRLPSFDSIKNTYRGELAEMSGWGISEGNKVAPEQLQWAKFEVIENSVCAKAFESPIRNSHICIATEKGISPCQGDSGGPLVLKSTNTQIGIGSFLHKSGCQKGQPAVFTRITSYLDWVKEKTGISY